MPEPRSIIATWDDFSGGDYGRSGGERAPKGTFHAENMLVYSNGMIGPRAGLRNITPASMPNGVLLGFVATPVPERDGVFIIGDTVYYFDLFTPATAPTVIDTLDQVPEQPTIMKLDTATLFLTNRWDDAGTSTSDGTYRVVLQGTPSLNKITDAPGGIDVALYNQQLIVALSQFSPQILGSSPTDPEDWSEGRYFPIGDNWQSTSLHVVRNALAILKRTGHHLLQGVLGDSDSERVSTVSTSDGPLHAWETARDLGDRVWFWPVFRKVPAFFNGAIVDYLGHLELEEDREGDATIAEPPLKRGVVVLEGHMTPSTIVFVQGGNAQRGIINHNGKWTRHHWETDISGLLGQGGPISPQFLATDGGADDAPAQFYTTLLNMDRPGFTIDGLAAPGDDSNTPVSAYLTLPQWWAPDGREVKPSQVIVDFDSWNTGTEETNHFDVTLRVLGRDRLADSVSTTTDGTPAAFDEVVTGSGPSIGDRNRNRRKTFSFEITSGSGVEITLSNIRGCAIRAVRVIEAKKDTRPL